MQRWTFEYTADGPIMTHAMRGEWVKAADAESAIAAAVAAERERCAMICILMAVDSSRQWTIGDAADEIRKGGAT